MTASTRWLLFALISLQNANAESPYALSNRLANDCQQYPEEIARHCKRALARCELDIQNDDARLQQCILRVGNEVAEEIQQRTVESPAPNVVAHETAVLEVQGVMQNPVTYFVVDSHRCDSRFEKIAEFQAGPPTSRTVHVTSGKRTYILVHHHLGYRLDRQRKPSLQVECKSLQSFVPAEGKRYQVLPRLASEHACSANILDTGSKGFAPGFRIEREHSACNPALPPDRR